MPGAVLACRTSTSPISSGFFAGKEGDRNLTESLSCCSNQRDSCKVQCIAGFDFSLFLERELTGTDKIRERALVQSAAEELLLSQF